MKFRFSDTTIKVNLPDLPQLLSVVAQRFASRTGFALATINLDHLVKLNRSARFRQAYGAHDIVVADGHPVVWLSRLAGKPVSLVPGSDLVRPLLQLAAQSKVRVALLGSTEQALSRASARLRAEIPGLDIALTIAPPMGFDPESGLATGMLQRINEVDVGLCLIALGAPKQEILAARGRTLAPRTGFASVGAGLDFLAGTQHRAPAWMRRLALEWLWRAFTDPRRLIPRYAACAAILPGETVSALRLRSQTEP